MSTLFFQRKPSDSLALTEPPVGPRSDLRLEVDGRGWLDVLRGEMRWGMGEGKKAVINLYFLYRETSEDLMFFPCSFFFFFFWCGY